MTVPEPVERCGYTITPVPNRAGEFLPLVHSMRISRDGQWAHFPARLWEDVAKADDEKVRRVLESLFYQAEAPTFSELPPVHDGLLVHALSAQIVVSRELVEDSASLAQAVADRLARPLPPPLTEAEREANRARREAEQAARLAALQADWQALRDQYADVPVLLAVLDVHQPSEGYVGECGHPVFGYECDAEDWPCTTIQAIKGATP